MDVTVLNGDFRAHRLQAFDVLIHRTCANRAAAWQRHPSLAKTRQQRPEHQYRCAHGFDQIIGCFGADGSVGMDGDFIVFQWRDIHAEFTQQFHRRANITQIGHIAQLHRVAREQSRAHNRQCGVFCTAHTNVTIETQFARAACDFELFHWVS